ncbi:hypothetical protein LCGC14_1339620 [marine sediment metagenome]|uniref:Peptidase A2 domain-containing protein n=1 Tax=marine sediment metagenome TaxID=412755 RepID=A0A0F9NGB7_9ZZZZ
MLKGLQLAFLTLVFSSTLCAEQLRIYSIPMVTNRCRMPVVEVKINGEKAVFVVDTGATITHLDPFTLKHALKNGQMATLDLGQIRMRIKVNEIKLDAAISKCGAINGVIGNDVLRSFSRVIFDFGNQKIVLEK